MVSDVFYNILLNTSTYITIILIYFLIMGALREKISERMTDGSEWIEIKKEAHLIM